MKKQIVKVSVRQSAKVLAVLYMVMSIPIVVVMAAVGMLGGGGVAMFAVILAPLIYGVLAFLGTGLAAWLYNLVANWVGGLEYSTKDV
jgi:hypothetical protein